MNNQKQGNKKKWYLRWWAITLYVIVLLLIISSFGDSDAQLDTTQQQATESSPTAEETVETTSAINQVTQPLEAQGQNPNPETNTVLYSIVSVTDGDTFKVSIDGKTETVRAIGIDTPETVDPRKPVQCFGTEASKRAKELLIGKKVKLQADPTQDNRDKYSRLLRYAWIEDGTFFNLKMITDGFAVEYTYQIPYQYQAEFKQAEAEAKAAKRGLWADNACPAGTPTNTNTAPPTATPTPIPQPSGFSCLVSKNCGDMVTCDEAYYYLNTCGKSSLDRDKDGVPCEDICK